MGCTILEFIIWLLYGYQGIKQFRSELQNGLDGTGSFYKIDHKGPDPKALVNPVVVKWINHMESNDLSHKNITALGQLLTIVKDYLLVVDFLPWNSSTDNDQVSKQSTHSKTTTSQVSPSKVDPVVQLDTPTIQITFDNSQEPFEPLDELVLSKTSGGHSYRIKANKLATYLRDILDNKEHGDDYWFRDSQSGLQRQLPKPVMKISYLDTGLDPKWSTEFKHPITIPRLTEQDDDSEESKRIRDYFRHDVSAESRGSSVALCDGQITSTAPKEK
jgi:hypothetical protein